jgi:hypothetical protein
MYVMPTSTASHATLECAQSDFSHGLHRFRGDFSELDGELPLNTF